MISFEDYKEGRIHFIGVGGCSMSGLAQILNNLGYQVSGSDLNDSPFMQTLREQNIPVQIGHDAAYVQGAALVIYSAAIKPSNVEFAYAKEHGIPTLEEPFSMVELMNADEIIVTSSSALCMRVESIDKIPVGGRDPQRLKLLQDAYLAKFQRETAR